MFQTQPFLMLRTDPLEDGSPLIGNDMYEGYGADLAKMVAKIVGYEYKIQPVGDGKYGSMEPDGSWNGMIGELMTGVSLVQGNTLILVLYYLSHTLLSWS